MTRCWNIWNSHYQQFTYSPDPQDPVVFRYGNLCDRCGEMGKMAHCYSYHKHNDFLVKFYTYLCGRCNSLYDPETKSFPKVSESEQAWLFLKLKPHK